MKKYFIFLLVLFIIPFKVDAARVSFGTNNETEINNDVKLSVIETEEDGSLSSIYKISFDLMDENNNILESFVVEKNGSFIWKLDYSKYGFGTYKIGNISLTGDRLSIGCPDEVFTILEPLELRDKEGPKMSNLKSNKKINSSEDFIHAGFTTQDESGFSEASIFAKI